MRRAGFGLALLVLALECAKPPPPVGPFPDLSYACFVERVEPELVRSCAYTSCHGAELRPLKVYSLAGVRGPHGSDDFLLSEREHQENFQRARVYATRTSAELPDLLRKPLQLEAGGAGHGGVDRFGRNVYASKDDQGWRALADWVNRVPPCDAAPGGGGGPGGGAAGGGAGGGSGGSGGGGGGPSSTCLPRPSAPNDWAAISTFIKPATCNDATGCHSAENFRDAGCVLTDSCEAIRAGGCDRPSVVPCDPLRSVLWRYAGGLKNHNSKFPAGAAQIIGAWIDAGASCDGGDWP